MYEKYFTTVLNEINLFFSCFKIKKKTLAMYKFIDRSKKNAQKNFEENVSKPLKEVFKKGKA